MYGREPGAGVVMPHIVSAGIHCELVLHVYSAAENFHIFSSFLRNVIESLIMQQKKVPALFSGQQCVLANIFYERV